MNRNRYIGSVTLLLLLVWGSAMSVQAQSEIKAADAKSEKAAFIRDGSLWLKTDGKEKQAVTGEAGPLFSPKWSYDGKFVAYAVGDGTNLNHAIWAYSLENGKSFRIAESGSRYDWSPNRNRLAYMADSVLYAAVVGPERAEAQSRIAEGIGNYSWQPDGQGVLVSSAAQLEPDGGWTRVRLYVIAFDGAGIGKARLLFTLPAQSDDFFAVTTSAFRWSHDGKWIAFQAIPTASLSADGNPLCVLSADGRSFRTVDPMLHDEEWFQWAPSESLLAYIEGIGRFAIENKQLRVTDMPVIRRVPYTPKGYVDRGFTWQSNRTLVVARSRESGWDSDVSVRPLPALYRVDLHRGAQRVITRPPAGFGDFGPQALASGEKLAWVRTDRKRAEAWLAAPDGSNAAMAVAAFDVPEPYYEAWDWSKVIAWYVKY